jgi:hypothetical protein
MLPLKTYSQTVNQSTTRIVIPEKNFRLYKQYEAENPRLMEALLEERQRAVEIEKLCGRCSFEDKLMWGMAGIIMGAVIMSQAR